MASRSYDRPDASQLVTHRYTPIIGNCPSTWELSEVCKIQRGSYFGLETKDFGKKKSSGKLLPLQPYIRWDYDESRPSGVYSGTYRKPVTGTATTMYNYTVNSIRGVSGSASSQAAAMALATHYGSRIDTGTLHQKAFADLLPELDALTTMVEAHKTIKMITSARTRAGDLIAQAMRGGKHTVKAASKAWLEWRYGWQQLGRDVQDIHSFLNYPIRDLIVEGRAGASTSGGTSSNNPYSGYYVKHDYITTLSHDLSMRVNVVATLGYKRLNLVASPSITAWESIPYSFVADWFVTVGDAIRVFVVLPQLTGYKSSVGVHFVENGSSEVTNAQTGDGAYATNGKAAGGAFSRSELKTRSPLGGVPQLPRIAIHLTSERLTDLASLLMKRIH